MPWRNRLSQRAKELDVASDGGAVALLGLPPDAARCRLDGSLRDWGEPGYRREQILSWVWEHRASGFDDMTNLPASLRRRLDSEYSLGSASIGYEARSSDGTVKHLWALADGSQVESVLIPTDDRVTLCLSSQVGCALGCRFCATGQLGFARQLTTAEIVEQYRNADRVSRRSFGRSIGNVVYMGMGEPFANPDPVFESLTVLNAGFGFGARRITVSTVGLVPGILRLSERPEAFRLAVSLHAADPDLRARLMPVERRYPLPDLLEAVREYQARKQRRVSFEYVMIDGVNDDGGLARLLVEKLSGISAYVNLIPFNPIPGVSWQASTPEAVAKFLGVLEASGVPTAVRTPRGSDIAAACGQLRLEREIRESPSPEA